MANVYATKTGNWSDTTVWNTGALPTASDDVYSNTYTVTIDQNVTVLSLRNTSATGIASQGKFVCSTARTIDCSAGSGFVSQSSVGGTTTSVLQLSHSAGTTITLKGTIPTGTVGSYVVVLIDGTGTTNYTGTVNGVAGGSIRLTAAHTLNIVGSLISSGASNGACVYCAAPATISITGSINQTLGSSYLVAIDGSATFTITGNIIQNSGTLPAIQHISGSPSVTIIGSVTGGGFPAILASINSGTLICSGPFYSSIAGIPPIAWSGSLKLTGITNNEFRFAKSTGGTTSLWSSDVTGGAPTTNNVRQGTTYGLSNEFTGTLAVPPTNSVASGVPVDNTTGTAALAPSDVAALVGAQIAAALDSAP